MAGIKLDGKTLARQIERELTQRVKAIHDATAGKVPTLATILVGNDPASATYVEMKGNACRRVGMQSRQITLPAATTTPALLDEIGRLNDHPDVQGILLQHPVPSQIDERRCFDAIHLDKDVDGVRCHGFGRMAMGERAYGARPQPVLCVC